MNQSLILIFVLMVMASMFTLISRQKHLLMALLALEAMMLSTVILTPLMLNLSNIYFNMLSVILLTFGACEASLGLSLMVIMSRTYGSDLMMSLTINKC